MRYLIVLCILLLGCGGEDTVTDIVLQQGTQGLTMEYITQGEFEVFEQDNVEVGVKIQNEGFNHIYDGLLIASVEQDLVEFVTWKEEGSSRADGKRLQFDLRGKTLGVNSGEFQIPNMIIRTKEILDTRNKIRSRITINGCYQYKTTFSEAICIDTDPFDKKIAQKTCKARDIGASSQGAPVAITKVKQRIIPSQTDGQVGLELTIIAENKGEGLLSTPDAVEKLCVGRGFTEDELNKIALTRLQFSEFSYFPGEISDFECSPNPMKQTREGFMTKCKLIEASQISTRQITFETPLIIELDYGYKIADSLDIDILNTDSSDETFI